jgi:hypothetical protein
VATALPTDARPPDPAILETPDPPKILRPTFLTPLKAMFGATTTGATVIGERPIVLNPPNAKPEPYPKPRPEDTIDVPGYKTLVPIALLVTSPPSLTARTLAPFTTPRTLICAKIKLEFKAITARISNCSYIMKRKIRDKIFNFYYILIEENHIIFHSKTLFSQIF